MSYDMDNDGQEFVFFVKEVDAPGKRWNYVEASSVDDAVKQYAESVGIEETVSGTRVMVFRAADDEPAHRTVSVEIETVRKVEVRL